ncbi:hypothetical protein E4U41_001440, partial [Claviceps citrina]
MATVSISDNAGTSSRSVPTREELRRFFDVRARRTQGCLTCRQRKVKCDQRRPVCNRCKRGMHRCLGYDEAFLFVNQALPGTQELPSKKSASQLKAYWNQQLGVVVASRGDRDRDRDKDQVVNNSPAPMVSLIGFKDHIVISHLVSNLRIGFEQNPVGTHDAPTMLAAMESFGKQTTAYVSGLGVAEVYFSRIHKVSQMTTHAAGLYGEALAGLRADLQRMDRDFSRSRAFLGLWTAYFLSLYELISCTRADGLWLQHARGVASLIYMLGPEAFQSPSANALYEVKRPFLAIAHFVMRKRCFLEFEEWKVTPWAHRPESKLPGSMLMDTFVDIPGIVEDADLLKDETAKMKLGLTSAADVEAILKKVQGKILTAIHNLAEARWKWEDMYPRVCWRTRINPTTTLCLDDDGKPLLDMGLNFVGLKRTFEILMYNASRILLFRLCDLAG